MSELPQLPYSADAERAVLGAVVLNDEALMVAAQQLDVSDFFLPVHRKIFSAMKRLAIAEKGVDFVTLLDEMERQSELAEDERAYVRGIADGLPRATNVEHYAGIIGEKRLLRDLVYAGDELRDQALAGTQPAADLLGRALERLNATNHREPLGIFDDYRKFMEVERMSFAIEGFIQNNAATAIAGLSGHGKTFVMLSVAKALLAGPPTKLWGVFPVNEQAERCIYLIPESTIPPFKHRLELLGILEHVRTQRLLVRTLSKGPAPELTDPRLLRAVEGAHVYLDTIIRFIPEGSDESSASDNQHGIAKGIFALLEAGARSVIFAHHAPKSFAKETAATLESVMRGSGDLGALLATCWAVRQIDAEKNLLHVTNVKPRDFEEPPAPFVLRGRPAISQKGDFDLILPPGQAEPLAHYLDLPGQNKGGGQPRVVREAKAANLALMRAWDYRNLSSPEIADKFKSLGVEVTESTVRGYRRQLEKENQA